MSYLNPNAPEPWASFVEQIERVKPHLGHLAKWIETMKHPKRILIVDVPIIRDDGSVAHYEGYRVQHSLSRGPGKGGVRFHPASPNRRSCVRQCAVVCVSPLTKMTPGP